jgi:hypothetical protein
VDGASQGSVRRSDLVPPSPPQAIKPAAARRIFTKSLPTLPESGRYGPSRLGWRGASLCGLRVT